MTAFTLTNGNDSFTGGTGADTFSGPGGGTDTLLGNGGNDTFKIQFNQTGLINGGTGVDRLFLVGLPNNELDPTLKIAGVENFYVSSFNIYATVAQLSGLSKIIPS